MPTRNVNLTNQYDEFVEEQVASDHFKNASEVMRAGLRLLEQHFCEEREKLAALRTLAAEGFGDLDQGRGIMLDGVEHLADFISRVGARASIRIATPPGGPLKSRKSRGKKSKSQRSSGLRRSAESM